MLNPALIVVPGGAAAAGELMLAAAHKTMCASMLACAAFGVPVIRAGALGVERASWGSPISPAVT